MVSVYQNVPAGSLWVWIAISETILKKREPEKIDESLYIPKIASEGPENRRSNKGVSYMNESVLPYKTLVQWSPPSTTPQLIRPEPKAHPKHNTGNGEGGCCNVA
jgi:hypothetical protein